MASTPAALASLPSAFAAACRLSRTEGELFERCRVALVRRFQSERIWFGLVTSGDNVPRVGPQEGFDQAVEVARLGSGETEVVIHADPSVVGEMRAVAMPLALGLSVVVELRSILLERQAALAATIAQRWVDGLTELEGEEAEATARLLGQTIVGLAQVGARTLLRDPDHWTPATLAEKLGRMVWAARAAI